MAMKWWEESGENRSHITFLFLRNEIINRRTNLDEMQAAPRNCLNFLNQII